MTRENLEKLLNRAVADIGADIALMSGPDSPEYRDANAALVTIGYLRGALGDMKEDDDA